MSGGCGATSMAEQLELFVQMAAAPPLKKNLASEAFTTVECETDISLAKLADWEEMESELNTDDDAVIDENFQRYKAMWDEEKQLDEELDTLRAQLKQDKAYNHRENQGHQQKVKKLQQMLQKVKKEDASRKKASESKVGKIKEQLSEEKVELTQKLEQARDLNKRLKQKLEAPALVESKETTKRLKSELHVLTMSFADEQGKAKLLCQEFEGNSAVQRVRQIEVDQVTQSLENLQKRLDTLKATASKRAQKIRDLSRKRDEMLETKDDAKEFVRALRCKHKVAKTKFEDMQGITRTTRTLSKSTKSSQVASSKSDEMV